MDVKLGKNEDLATVRIWNITEVKSGSLSVLKLFERTLHCVCSLVERQNRHFQAGASSDILCEWCSLDFLLKLRVEGFPVLVRVACALFLAMDKNGVLLVFSITVDFHLEASSNSCVFDEDEAELVGVHFLDLLLDGQGVTAVTSAAAELDAHDLRRVFVSEVFLLWLG